MTYRGLSIGSKTLVRICFAIGVGAFAILLLVFSPSRPAAVAAAASPQARADSIGINSNALSAINKGDPAAGAKVLDALVQSGAGWARIGAIWSAIEKDQGTYNWKNLDKMVSALRSRHIQILLTIARTPCWARADAGDECVRTSTKERRIGADLPTRAAWQQFVTALVVHYRGQISYYEIWNEPNWAPNVFVNNAPSNSDALLAAYRNNLLVPGAQAIHAADSSAHVVAPAIGMAGIDSPEALTRELAVVLGNGAAKQVDVVSIHLYAHDMFAYGAGARAAMSAAGIADKPLWLTEFGRTADWGLGTTTSVTLSSQADFLTQALQHNENSHTYDKLFWYSLVDNGALGGSWATSHSYGLLNDDLTPRPAFTALKNFIAGAN